MSKKNKLWIILGILLTVLLSGCDCDGGEIAAFVVTSDTPIDGAIVSSNPTFTWHESESCTPNRFKIWVVSTFYGGESSHSEFVDGSETSHTLVSTLDSGKKYTWHMYAVAEDQSVSGIPSSEQDFYVGPLCSGQPILAPILLSPHENAMINDVPPLTFTWEYEGGCLPSSYMYQFATDIGFTDVVDTGVITDHQMEMTKSFPDCSTLWWRVAASDGTSSGPWSSPSAFHLANSSSCPQIEDDSINTAWIYLSLFADDCPGTGTAPISGDPLNPGCVISSSGLILHGDGENWSEPYLHDFVAQLGAGPCPSTGLDEGTNGFLVQTPGIYCVSITKAQTALTIDTSASVNLQHGIWTQPFSYNTVAEMTVEFGPGHANTSVTFGWDQLDNLFPMPRLIEPKNCRFGPEPICPIYDIPMMGAQIPIFARDAKSEWNLTEINDQPCYILLEDAVILQAMQEVGEPDWQVADLPIFLQPDPCEEPEKPSSEPRQKACSEHKNNVSCRIDSRCIWINSNVRVPYCTKK